MKKALLYKSMTLVIVGMLSHESRGENPSLGAEFDLGSVRQMMEKEKTAYLEKKARLESKQQKARQDFEQIQEKSARDSELLLKMIQDETAQKEDIQREIESLRDQTKHLNTAKLELLKEKRQILKEKHQENHRLRQILLKIKRFYGEKLTQLYAKG